MIRAICIFVFLTFSMNSLVAQTINDQITDNSVIEFTHGKIKFNISVAEADRMFNSLYMASDPANPVNKYMPPKLKERLRWIRENAIVIPYKTFPPGIDNTADLSGMALASANYCNIPVRLIYNAPCVLAYPLAMMVSMRVNFMQLKPNQLYRESFAIWLGHEGVHLENPYSFFAGNPTGHELVKEEKRAWLKTIRDFVAPMRDNGRVIFRQFAELDDLLKLCKYVLPCPAFDKEIERRYAHILRPQGK